MTIADLDLARQKTQRLYGNAVLNNDLVAIRLSALRLDAIDKELEKAFSQRDFTPKSCDQVEWEDHMEALREEELYAQDLAFDILEKN